MMGGAILKCAYALMSFAFDGSHFLQVLGMFICGVIEVPMAFMLLTEDHYNAVIATFWMLCGLSIIAELLLVPVFFNWNHVGGCSRVCKPGNTRRDGVGMYLHMVVLSAVLLVLFTTSGEMDTSSCTSW